MNLRYIERDGKLVLQQREVHFVLEINGVPSKTEYREWQDVPIVTSGDDKTNGDLKIQNKPREFWIDREPTHTDKLSIRNAYTFENRKSDIHVTTIPKGCKLISREQALYAYYYTTPGRVLEDTSLQLLGFNE